MLPLASRFETSASSFSPRRDSSLFAHGTERGLERAEKPAEGYLLRRAQRLGPEYQHGDSDSRAPSIARKTSALTAAHRSTPDTFGCEQRIAEASRRDSRLKRTADLV
jgi:hypothetical protein